MFSNVQPSMVPSNLPSTINLFDPIHSLISPPGLFPYGLPPEITITRPSLDISFKPSNMQQFNRFEILTYVTSGYSIKYQKVVPSIVPLISAFWSFIPRSFWRLFHTLQTTTNRNTKNITISSSYNVSCWYFMLLLSTRGLVTVPIPWFQYILLQSLAFLIMVQYPLPRLPWDRI